MAVAIFIGTNFTTLFGVSFFFILNHETEEIQQISAFC